MADKLEGQGGGYREESAGQYQERDAPDIAAERAIVEEVKECLKFTKDFEEAQRRAEVDEAVFEGVDMWEEDARKARGEHEDDATGRKVPAKPTVSVNLLDQDIQQRVSEGRQARLSLTVKPKNGLSTNKTGTYLKGLVRAIQAESGALEVRLWALERAIKIGRGGYRLAAEFATEDDFDVELREERILDYGSVYWDPYSVRPDRSDASWCIISDWMSEGERRRRWPTKPLIVPNDILDDDEGVNNDWFSADPENKKLRRCRVATFYKVVHEEYVLGFTPQTGPAWVGKGPEGSSLPILPADLAAKVIARAPGTQKRKVQRPTVMIYVVDGSQTLEKTPWLGRFIPVFETIGKEYFVKGKRRWKGIIANAMELSSAINVLVSACVEVAAASSRAQYLMAEGQDEGHEEMWDNAAIKNYTRLYYRTKDIEGNAVGAPQRQQIELQVQGLVLLLQTFHNLYHAVTGSVSPQARAVDPNDRSGKAIDLLQRQGAAGTSNYLDNLATITMLYEGRVILDAIPNYYDRPGRVIRVSDDESDDDTAIMIKVPFIHGKDGAPIAVPCPACQGQGSIVVAVPSTNIFITGNTTEICPTCKGTTWATKENAPKVWQDKEVEYVDFGEGEYKVVAAVDRDYQVRQDEALHGMSALAQAAPNLVPMYADVWVRAMGFSGSTEIADRIRSQMPQGDEDLEDIPPQLLGKFLALKKQHEQAMQALNQAHQMLQTDAVKNAGKKDIEMIRAAVQKQIEQLKQQGQVLKLRASNAEAERLEVLRGRIEEMRSEQEYRHNIVLNLLKELGAKEVERHSVALHTAAARVAARDADLSAAGADARKELMAGTAHARDEASATRADSRADASAAAADARAEAAAARASAREETAPEAET